MTITEEIKQAMRAGASAMFLYGLLAEFQRDPKQTMGQVEAAAFELEQEHLKKVWGADNVPKTNYRKVL